MTEFLYATSHLAGNFPNPGNAVGDTPASWAGNLNVNENYTSRWAMGNPSDDLEGTQTIRVVARKGSNSGTPTIQVNLYEDGSLVQSLVATTNITSTTGQTLTGTFSAAAITNAANVEVEVVQTGTGGNPSTRNSAQISHIEFEAAVVETGPPEVTAQPLSFALALGPADSTGEQPPPPPEFEMWPISDAAAGNWTVFSLGFEQANQHWSHLNAENDLAGIETIGVSDTTYRANLDTPPDTPSGATVHIRASADFDFGSLTVGLFEGGSHVWTSDPFNPVFALDTYDIAVPQGVVDGINDWSTVSLAVTATSGDENYAVTWMRLTANVASGVPTAQADPLSFDLGVGPAVASVPTPSVPQAAVEPLSFDLGLLAVADVPAAPVPEVDADGLAFNLAVGPAVANTPAATVPQVTANEVAFEVGLGPAIHDTPVATVPQVAADGVAFALEVGPAVSEEPSEVPAHAADGVAIRLQLAATAFTPTPSVLQAAADPLSLELQLGPAAVEQPEGSVPRVTSSGVSLELALSALADAPTASVPEHTAGGLQLSTTLGPATAVTPAASVPQVGAGALQFELAIGPATVDIPADLPTAATADPLALKLALGPAVTSTPTASVPQVVSGLSLTLDVGPGTVFVPVIISWVTQERAGPTVYETVDRAEPADWGTQERADPADWLELVGPSAPLTTETGQPIVTETNTPISVLVTFSWGDQEPLAPLSWTTQERA